MTYHGITSRKFAEVLQKSLKNAPVTAILGPRQCGKTTLAKMLVGSGEASVMLDLERTSDRDILLRDAESFFNMHSDCPASVCIKDSPPIFIGRIRERRSIWFWIIKKN